LDSCLPASQGTRFIECCILVFARKKTMPEYGYEQEWKEILEEISNKS
jgi:hypothetical protein